MSLWTRVGVAVDSVGSRDSPDTVSSAVPTLLADTDRITVMAGRIDTVSDGEAAAVPGVRSAVTERVLTTVTLPDVGLTIRPDVPTTAVEETPAVTAFTTDTVADTPAVRVRAASTVTIPAVSAVAERETVTDRDELIGFCAVVGVVMEALEVTAAVVDLITAAEAVIVATDALVEVPERTTCAWAVISA